MRRVALPLMACALLLSGCGLRPLYGHGPAGSVAQSLHAIEVAPIEGKAGWLMMQALGDRLSQPGAGSSAYRLEMTLDDHITSFGLRRDNSVSRERRTLRARYQLLEIATGRIVLDATAGADAGIDFTQSDYATIAAEETALERLSIDLADQITARLALFAKRQTGPQ